MDGHRLRALVDAGCSLQQIADELAVPRWAVRRAVLDLGLETERMRSFRLNAEARQAGSRVDLRRCSRHGDVEHRADSRGTFHCPACKADAVAAHRRTVKATLIAEAGGRCAICGYDRCPAALHFHHVDPATKAFGLAHGGWSRSLESARAEAAKCVLLCGNCHAEVEAGVTARPRGRRYDDLSDRG
jgi:hypothetical protein